MRSEISQLNSIANAEFSIREQNVEVPKQVRVATEPQSNSAPSESSFARTASSIIDGLEGGRNYIEKLSPEIGQSTWASALSKPYGALRAGVSAITGARRVFQALDQDVRANSQLYERTAMAIPLSVAQVAGSSYSALLVGQGVGWAVGTGVLGAGIATTAGGVVLAGAAAVGAGYLIGEGLDWVGDKFSSYLK